MSKRKIKKSVYFTDSEISKVHMNANKSQILPEDKSHKIVTKCPNKASFVSISEYSNNYNTNSIIETRPSIMNSHEKQVPLFKSGVRSGLNSKVRRTRNQRELDVSADKYATSLVGPKKSMVYNRNNISKCDNVYFNSNIGHDAPTTVKTQKSRTTFCSRERTSYVAETGPNGGHKLTQLEKAQNNLTTKAFQGLQRIRPTQVTIKVVRMFFKLLRKYSKHYRQYNINESWIALTNTLATNGNLIVHEVKAIVGRFEEMEVKPEILEEINSALFVKKVKRGVPSCSTTFQREVKPITNFLQALNNYFDLRDRSADGRSDFS